MSASRRPGRVGVLISGRGSNLQALLDAAAADRLGGQVAVVISNVAEAAGLERARRAQVPAVVEDHRGRSREDQDRAMLEHLRAHDVSLVCLAGYMRLLSPVLIRAFPDRVLNVHPSLLPAFPGLDAQHQAWEHGVKVSGATVHLVDEGLDTGPIVLQEAVPVLADDTPQALAARILEAEHRIYPQAVRLVLSERVRREGRRLVEETGS
ncbi:MAG TPA: phosphoribosylglycinamide formyltransferase [Vicinamibacteria bacterium]|nr:phosphoribosylglycinamide formyltransferase [Vicinamibacteria bacterium]